jgi:hypothetical protein
MDASYPEGVFITYDIRHDEDNKKESGPHSKHFASEEEYHNWLTTQDGHPWLHIHIITKSA